MKQGYFSRSLSCSELLWDAVQEAAGLGDIERTADSAQFAPEIQGATDVERLALARREQYQLRKYLLQKRELRCGICGREMPARYLHAAHIKKRSTATERERKDLENIVMWACTLGRDQAFECGDLAITPEGTITLSSSDTVFLNQAFGHLEGQKAPAFNTDNAHYFAARSRSR